MTLTKRYDFVLLFDVKDGNPNGDPDMDNVPRFDPEDNTGLVTDVCIKRKIRNFVTLKHEEKAPYDIFVKDGAILNDVMEDVINEVSENTKRDLKGTNKEQVEKRKKVLCDRFYDIRTFGAVLSTGKDDYKSGQVRGPVQFTFARSLDPVTSLTHTITRMASTDKKENQNADQNRTMGRKHTVSYALYKAYGYVSASFAKDTGFTEKDLELLWEALEKMFWDDHSAARGHMSTVGLYVFEHESKLGNASADDLFERIKVESKTDIPRSLADYHCEINENMPQGVTLDKKIHKFATALKEVA